jgi:hypothetical protein
VKAIDAIFWAICTCTYFVWMSEWRHALVMSIGLGLGIAWARVDAYRIGNGVCPCCNRSFTNLRRHMTTKHPEYPKEPK